MAYVVFIFSNMGASGHKRAQGHMGAPGHTGGNESPAVVWVMAFVFKYTIL